MKKLKETIENLLRRQKEKKILRTVPGSHPEPDKASPRIRAKIIPVQHNAPQPDRLLYRQEEKDEPQTGPVVPTPGLEVPGWDNDLPEEDNLVFADTVEVCDTVVRKVLDDMEIQYDDTPKSCSKHVFSFTARDKHKKMTVRIVLLEDFRTCRIDVVYPFEAVRELDFVLCRELAGENYIMRYGSVKYDRNDGELLYQYSFPLFDSMDEAYFHDILLMVLGSASDAYDSVKRFADGRFYKDERNEITCDAQNLIIEVNK